MKKRVMLLVFAALLVLPATAFSANLLGLRVGPSALYMTPLDEIDDDLEFAIEDFKFGVDARLNFSVLEGNALAYFSRKADAEDVWSVDTLLNAGLSFPVANVLRLGVFAGPRFTFNIGEDEEADFDVMDFGLNLKGTADFMLGNLGLSVFSIVDTGLKLGDIGEDDFEFGDLFADPSISFGASLLFTVF